MVHSGKEYMVKNRTQGNVFIRSGWMGSAFLCGLLACAPKTAQWKTEVIFSSDKVQSKRLETGKSLLMLPVIVNSTFDTSATLSPAQVKKLLLGEQSTVQVLFKKDLEALFHQNNQAVLDSFYTALFKNDILAVATYDSVWNRIPTSYVLVLRVDNAVRISSFDGVLKKRGVVEGELWDVRTMEAVWRARATGAEMDKKVTDREFIACGIREVFTLLPEFIPVRDEVDW